jgi:ketosteroid isomerase-like protein
VPAEEAVVGAQAQEVGMHARNPEEICLLFQQCMERGDVDALLDLYDSQVAFVNESGEVKLGLDALRGELAPIAARKPRFDFEVKLIARSGDLALMHTLWTISYARSLSE